MQLLDFTWTVFLDKRKAPKRRPRGWDMRLKGRLGAITLQGEIKLLSDEVFRCGEVFGVIRIGAIVI